MPDRDPYHGDMRPITPREALAEDIACYRSEDNPLGDRLADFFEELSANYPDLAFPMSMCVQIIGTGKIHELYQALTDLTPRDGGVRIIAPKVQGEGIKPMNKPTCDTCPYWDEIKRDDESQGLGLCLRFPQQWIGSRMYMPFPGLDIENWSQPLTTDSDSCGEHPLFPKYIASLKGPS